MYEVTSYLWRYGNSPGWKQPLGSWKESQFALIGTWRLARASIFVPFHPKQSFLPREVTLQQPLTIIPHADPY